MVPDHLFIVEQVYNSASYDLTTHEGQAAFVDVVVYALNAHDPKWGHLRKKQSQKNIHGHGEDSALYKLPNNKAWSVDFIGGAGGPSPVLRWGPDPVAYYSHADWLDPAEHDAGDAPAPPPTPRIPSYEELGGDVYWRAEIGVPLQADMAAAGQTLNDGSSVWFSRPIFQILEAYAKGQTPDRPALIKKTRNEWRAILGQPPL